MSDFKDAKWEKEEKKAFKVVVFSLSMFCLIIVSLLIFCLICGCTISFQNISTHGTATDLVDENQTTSPKTSANIPLSIKP